MQLERMAYLVLLLSVIEVGVHVVPGGDEQCEDPVVE